MLLPAGQDIMKSIIRSLLNHQDQPHDHRPLSTHQDHHGRRGRGRRSSAQGAEVSPQAQELGDELTLVGGQEWAKQLLVNLKHIKYLSSTGFAVLFNLVKQAQGPGRRGQVLRHRPGGPHRRGDHRPGQGRRDPRDRARCTQGLLGKGIDSQPSPVGTGTNRVRFSPHLCIAWGEED